MTTVRHSFPAMFRRPTAASARKTAIAVAVAAVVFYVAYDHGAFDVIPRYSVGIVAWWIAALAIGVGVWPIVQPPVGTIVVGSGLAAFGIWEGLSMLWASSAERAFAEADRTFVYVGVFTVAALAGTRATARRWSDGVAVGIAAIGVVALLSRCFRSLFPSSQELPRYIGTALTRLSFPLDYWNGLAIFVALAFPLLLRVAVADRRPLPRALALAVTPALAADVYLASSRGGAITAVVGAVVFVTVCAHRPSAVAAVALVAVGAAAAVAVVSEHRQLVNHPDLPAAASQGHVTALLVLSVGVFVGAFWLILVEIADRLPRPPLPPRPARLALAAVAVAALVVAGVVEAHPVARFRAFKTPPPSSAQPLSHVGQNPVQEHLLSGGSTGRWQEWSSAVDEWRTKPLTGRGAGAFEAWWAQHGSIPGFIQNAHSLYVETLGDLGLIGLALILFAFVSALVVGASRVRSTASEERTTVAALMATFVAFAVAAGIDWMWQLTAVSVAAMIVLGVLVGSGTARPRAATGTRGTRWLLRVPVVVLGSAVIVALAIPVYVTLRIERSQAAVGRGDAATAAAQALSARKVEPWAASPYLQLALVTEQAGDLRSARTWIKGAIHRDPTDWALWLAQARIQTKSGLIDQALHSLHRALALNPRSPLLAPLKGRT